MQFQSFKVPIYLESQCFILFKKHAKQNSIISHSVCCVRTAYLLLDKLLKTQGGTDVMMTSSQNLYDSHESNVYL